jgi:hypothetical protein
MLAGSKGELAEQSNETTAHVTLSSSHEGALLWRVLRSSSSTRQNRTTMMCGTMIVETTVLGRSWSRATLERLRWPLLG